MSKYFIVFTDINSRQYPIEIPDEGVFFQIQGEEPTTLYQDNDLFGLFINLDTRFAIGNAVLNPDHLVSCQFQTIPD